MTVVSTIIYSICYGMIIDRLIYPVQYVVNQLPEFTITNGQLNMPESSDPYIQKNETWEFVMTLSDEFLGKRPLDKNYLAISGDKVCFEPLIKSPDRDPLFIPTRDLNGAKKEDLAWKLRDAAHRNTIERSLVDFVPLFLYRFILASVLGILLSVIQVNHVCRSHMSCQIIASYAQVPAIIVEMLMMLVTAVVYHTNQAVPMVRPLNIPLFLAMAGMYVLITAGIAFWAHYKMPRLAGISRPDTLRL